MTDEGRREEAARRSRSDSYISAMFRQEQRTQHRQYFQGWCRYGRIRLKLPTNAKRAASAKAMLATGRVVVFFPLISFLRLFNILLIEEVLHERTNGEGGDRGGNWKHGHLEALIPVSALISSLL